MSTTRQNPKSRKYPPVDVERTTADDAERLIGPIEALFNAGRYSTDLTFDRERGLGYLRQAIGSGFAVYLLAVDSTTKQVIGFGSYHLDQSFTTRPVAHLDELFVLEEFHRTHAHVGRILIAMMLSMAQGDGAAMLHFPITSGHAAARSLVNLLEKFGAEPVGLIMRRML